MAGHDEYLFLRHDHHCAREYSTLCLFTAAAICSTAAPCHIVKVGAPAKQAKRPALKLRLLLVLGIRQNVESECQEGKC
jgi:hypothetical protein